MQIPKQFIKIACSITLSVLGFAVLASIIIGLFELAGGGHKYESMIFPFMISGPLLLIFGVPASAIWWCVSLKNRGAISGHGIGAILATIIITVGFVIAVSLLDSKIHLLAFGIAAFLTPVAIGSFVIHKRYFLNK